MRFKKLLVIGTAAVAVVASVTGAALASGHGRKAPAKPAVSAATTDSDNIQEGDQSSPDSGVPAPEANVAAATSVKAGTKASASAGEVENSGEGENSGESDGPGGHQDPPGQDINHEFNGQE